MRLGKMPPTSLLLAGVAVKARGDGFDADTCAICWEVPLATASDLERVIE